MKGLRILRLWAEAFGVAISGLAYSADSGPAVVAISFSREVLPILQRSCVACHQPSKLKGGLDLSSFASLSKGGKHGPVFIAGAASKSFIVAQVKGSEPEMPPEGEHLTTAEVAVIERWIEGGAIADNPDSTPNDKPRRYIGRPILTAVDWSPDNRALAVAGNGEVWLYAATNYIASGRWHGAAERIEALRYSPDGQALAAVGGTPGRFGEVQFWSAETGALQRSVQSGDDSWLSVDWSPDAGRVVVAGADKTVRVISVADGRELVRFDQHTDWVFGACFTADGQFLVTAGRDRSMKLLEAATGRWVDELVRPNEPLLGVRRHPRENLVANLGAEARVRVFKAQAKADRNDPNADSNYVREYEHFDGGLSAASYSADGKWLALAGIHREGRTEVRIHDATGTQRKVTLPDHDGTVFGLAFSPDGTLLATVGFEGLVRVFVWEKERLSAIWSVP